MDQEIQAVTHYLELEKIRFGDKLNYSFDIDVPVEVDRIKIPSMLILPFLENSIWHGLAPLKDGGSLFIRIIMIDKKLKCIIEDNGIGYKAPKGGRRKNHESVGLEITKQRMALYFKEGDDSQHDMSIVDKKVDLGKENGTIVSFNMPYEYSEF